MSTHLCCKSCGPIHDQPYAYAHRRRRHRDLVSVGTCERARVVLGTERERRTLHPKSEGIAD